MQPDDATRIKHIFEAAEEVQQFLRNRKKEDLFSDKLLLRAVTKSVEIIGEAAARLSLEAQAEIPEVPWRIIIGMRNWLIHAYFDINIHILWDTATINIPDLVSKLKARGLRT